jgi:uncharacterized protein YjbI with pentapeptide repeats
MANDEHVAILKKGVDAWNAWRDENPNILPDLSAAKLSGADLKAKNLSGANLSGADLQEANLDGANLSGADLQKANLDGANLSGADLSAADLQEANLSGSNLSAAELQEANLDGAKLSGADLSGATSLSEANLSGAELHHANLIGADLSGADLSGADLRGANLMTANLIGANLMAANLIGANLTEAVLMTANLIAANLTEAHLSKADLRGANLTGANLISADLTEAALQETVFGATSLAEVKGLNHCHHHAPSVIDFLTLKNSGPLPIAFLRGVGLPDNLIEYLPSLLNEATQHYSCFISYSGEDAAFAQRLHADLQNKGVRCWFAPHDMTIGAKIIDAIDKAIRLRDKVLLILSEGAIASDWVEGEVTRALDEERTRKQVVLLPVRLDDTILKTDEPWASRLRDQRNIGDFSRWKEHDHYQKSFKRLMRDLRVKVNVRRASRS